MTDWPILSAVTFLPLVGVALLLLTREDSVYGRRNILNVSLLTTVFTFVLSLFIWIGFDNSNPGFQMVEKSEWLGTGISYHLGVSGERIYMYQAVPKPIAMARNGLHFTQSGTLWNSCTRWLSAPVKSAPCQNSS